MCDRTKQEILARELCFMYHKGIRNALELPAEREVIYDYIERHYKSYMVTSVDIIKTLDKHNI